MRKRAKKLLALLTAVTITVTGVNVPAAQAAKVKVTASKTTLYYNGTGAEKKATVTVKNVKGKKVTYSISKAGKKIVKLGDVSGNKTKKFTVTAKKKGTAKVTVKVAGKKVKTIKFTVKKKTAKATPNPTVAPTQAPTQEPSQEPTVAPTDEPTVAPTDAPSDAPTVAPTQEPVKDKSVVTEIKILNETALTNEEGTKAYVYYDVLDQYGESMKESVSINWTTSPAGGKADKATGKIAISAGTDKDGKAEKFTYGSKIYIVGVDNTTGVSVNQEVTVGLAQSVDKVSFAGFISNEDKTTILETLPADFKKDTFSLLYKTYDQNGNVLDVTETDEQMEYIYGGKNVFFMSDNPMLMSMDADNQGIITIKGEDYATIAVQPGTYADRGGEVNVTAVSGKTGTKSTQNFVVGTNGILKSLELKMPSGTLADGDKDVKLAYVAKNTAGKEITNYETIVRGTNSLKVGATDGTLTVKEENDGTAGIYWSDDQKKYAQKTAASYANSGDGQLRNVMLSTIVVGGETNMLTLSVDDMRIPASIASADGQTVASTNTATTSISFKDQYGADLDGDVAGAFFTYAGANPYGKGANKGKYYGIKIATSATSKIKINGSVSDQALTFAGKPSYTVTADTTKATATNETLNETIKVSLATTEKNPAKATLNDWDVEGKSKAVENTVVALKDLSNPTIEGVKGVVRYETTGLSAYIAAKDLSGAAITVGAELKKPSAGLPYDCLAKNNDAAFKVMATYNGKSVQVPWDVVEKEAGSAFTINENAGDGYAVVDALSKAPAYADAFNTKAYGEPAKNFTKSLVLEVTLAKTQKISKDVTGRIEDRVATSAFFHSSYNPSELASIEYAPNVTNIDALAGEYDFASSCGGWSGHEAADCDGSDSYNEWQLGGVPYLAVKDQFGRVMFDNFDATFTLTEVSESTEALAHKKGNLTVSGSGSAAPSITGAEIGDTFVLTGKVNGTTVSASLKCKVVADKSANLVNDKDNDLALRTALGIKRGN